MIVDFLSIYKSLVRYKKIFFPLMQMETEIACPNCHESVVFCLRGASEGNFFGVSCAACLKPFSFQVQKLIFSPVCHWCMGEGFPFGAERVGDEGQCSLCQHEQTIVLLDSVTSIPCDKISCNMDTSTTRKREHTEMYCKKCQTWRIQTGQTTLF